MARDTVTIALDKERTLCLNMEACEKIATALGMGDEFDMADLLGRLQGQRPKVYTAFLWGMASSGEHGDPEFTIDQARRAMTMPRMKPILEAVAILIGKDPDDAAEAGAGGPPVARG
jgi:hypothetical protein